MLWVYSKVIQLFLFMFFSIVGYYNIFNMEYSSLCYTVGPCYLSTYI